MASYMHIEINVVYTIVITELLCDIIILKIHLQNCVIVKCCIIVLLLSVSPYCIAYYIMNMEALHS